DHMASSLVEPDRARRIAPRLAAVVRELERGAPPRALAGNREAAGAQVGNVIDFTAFEERPLERPGTARRVGLGHECALPRPDEQQCFHGFCHHISYMFEPWRSRRTEMTVCDLERRG